MPKACMISHDNVGASMTVGLGVLSAQTHGPQRVLSYLPLSHVAGWNVDVIIPIVGTSMYDDKPATVYFARKYDMSDATIVQRLKFVEPTAFT